MIKQICPTCGDAFLTKDEAREHWLAKHAQPEPPAVEVETIVRKICPTCGEAFATEEEGRQHWLEKHGPAAARAARQSASASAEEGANDGGCSGAALVDAAGDALPEGKDVQISVAKCKLIAKDDQTGEPTIVRHIEGGQSRTIVMNKDGTQRIFGESTISSMSARDEADVEQWIAAMTDLQLRGLVHEFSERVVEGSQRYHKKRERVERLTESIGRHMFNLTDGASEKELDVAYRKLARSMHPDKNGGTEEAKERFQAMNQRYKDMKAKMASGGSAPSAAPVPRPTAEGDEREGSEQNDQKEESNTERRKEAYDEDAREEEEVRRQRQQQAPAFLDPLVADREALEKEAWKMLRQMKVITQNMKMIDSDMERVEAEARAEQLPLFEEDLDRTGAEVGGEPGGGVPTAVGGSSDCAGATAGATVEPTRARDADSDTSAVAGADAQPGTPAGVVVGSRVVL